MHVSDQMPGLQRVRRGQHFAYRDAAGHWLRDPQRLQQIRALAIPPAYTDVWICPLPNGHLQATGRDARGRKQYRYHPDYRAQREDPKFERLAEREWRLLHFLEPRGRGRPRGTPLASGQRRR